MNKIIIIGGGSFQGKSLLALHVAFKLEIPHIICTDTIRSILHVLNPNAPYFFTSTYLMSPENLERQIEEVSKTIQKVLLIYERRGESVIIEGMHLSPEFLTYLSKKPNTLILCIDNRLPLIKRLEYKSLTRHKVEYYDPKTGKVTYGPITEDKLHLTRYLPHANRIEEIHREIVESFLERDLPVLRFTDLNLAIKRVYAMIEKW